MTKLERLRKEYDYWLRTYHTFGPEGAKLKAEQEFARRKAEKIFPSLEEEYKKAFYKNHGEEFTLFKMSYEKNNDDENVAISG